jgi:uncharacterized protein YhaN
LRSALERRAKLSERVDQMQADRSAFAAEVAAIAASMGFEPGADPPLDAARAMAGRVRDARTAVAARDVAARNLNDAQSRQRKLAEALALHGRRAAEMTAHFGVASLPEVGAKLSDIERKHRFEAQAAEATRDILAAMRAESIEDAGALLDAADRAALEAELAELQARFDDQDGRTRELFATHGKAADHVEGVGGDDAVARIEERRRTILLQIEDGALRYIRLRAGVVAAEHALRAYRQVHRSSMMSQASEAFRTISRDAYTGLASQPSRESEILIAQAAGGGAKLASELSKGTRFQLYLALRVAGYHEFARSRPPVPFIADDIMETFDDDRAEESLRLFATMAQVGQVIYLTHHRHLSEIASRICPCVRIHKL